MRLWFLFLLWTSIGCRREIPEWNLFFDLPSPTRLLKQPSSPLSLTLALPPHGLQHPPTTEHVLLAGSGRILLLDAWGRRILDIPVIHNTTTEPTSWLPVWFLEKQRQIVFLQHDTLWTLTPTVGATMRPWVKIPETALCGIFQPPLENFLQTPENFGLDRASENLCMVLEEPSDSRRIARIAMNLETQTFSHDCSVINHVSMSNKKQNAPLFWTACSRTTRPQPESVPFNGTIDETTCSVQIHDARITFLTEEEETGNCHIQWQGADFNQRYFVWCISDTQTEYSPQTCYIVDTVHRRKLEPTIEILPDTHIRWSPRRESIMLGEYVFFFQPDPVRMLPVEGRTLLFL